LWLVAGAMAVFAANPPAVPASFAGWTQTGTQQAITSENSGSGPAWLSLWPVIQEYGFDSGWVQQYTRDGKTISVTLYRMKDPSGAYGLYSFLRTPDMARAAITEHSCMSAGIALILDSSVVIEVAASAEGNLARLEPDFKSLVAAIGPIPSEGPYPDLFKRLPLRGFQQGTDRYVLGPVALHQVIPVADGDWVGFASGAEAETGQYRFDTGNHTALVIVIDYPTPQVASKMQKDWAASFNLENQDPKSNKPTIYTSRKLTTVEVVAGIVSAAEAKALLAQLDSGEELTWNEPGFSLADANLNAVIASIIVGTGILCMFTLVAGLAFGGVRLVVKRVLPGRVFDRGTAMNVLQLGLASKPINSDDFYGIGKASRPLSESGDS
jgi:hypothetical protein